jgi:outer membrane receptor protein involved in Fe transport
LSVNKFTNAEGEFDFGEPSATRGLEWRLRVTARGFAIYNELINTRDGSASRLVLVLAPASVSEEVIVSAARTETRLSDTPASIVVINKEQIATTAATTLDDVLKQLPGFQLFRRTSSRYSNPTTQASVFAARVRRARAARSYWQMAFR